MSVGDWTFGSAPGGQSQPQKHLLTYLQGSGTGRQIRPKAGWCLPGRGGLENPPSETKETIDHSEAQARDQDLRRTRELTFGCEGDIRSLGSRTLETRTCEGPWSPKAIKHWAGPRRRTPRPSEGTGVRVKREYERRSDLCTSHLVTLPWNRLLVSCKWVGEGQFGDSIAKG